MVVISFKIIAYSLPYLISILAFFLLNFLSNFAMSWHHNAIQEK